MASRRQPEWLAHQPSKLEALRRAIRPAYLGDEFVRDVAWEIHKAPEREHREWMHALAQLKKRELEELGRLAWHASSSASIELVVLIEGLLGKRISRRTVEARSGDTRAAARPVLASVQVRAEKDPSLPAGQYTVHPVWRGVDRPDAGGWLVPKKYVDRLRRAILAGAACPNPVIKTDVDGKTYVHWDLAVMGKYINSDLKKLGF